MVVRIPAPGPGPAVSALLPVQPLAALERAGDARLDAFQRTLATMLGSQVPVTVMARMQDGSFLVRLAETRLADTPVRMLLLPGTQPGAQLTMTVLAASPQPTFGLGNATLQGSLLAPADGTTSAASATGGAATSGAPPAGPAPASMSGQQETADLSPAARLLSQVLQGAAHAPAAALAGAAPLLAQGQGAPDPAQLATQLQQAIAKSGLFYESHVAQWAEGKRPLAELMAEPQAQKAPGTPPTEPATAQLINQQLAAHEHGHLAWQGQLGPGQPLHWDITRQQAGDPGDDTHPDQDGAPGWESRLRLRFALLGEVEARLSLRGDQLHVDLQAAGAAAESLRLAAPRLHEALAAAGSALAALRIHGREDA